MKYKSVKDLLTDEGFLAWYFKTDQQQVTAWNAWIEESEQNRTLAAEAMTVLQRYEAAGREDITQTKEDVERLWKRLQAAIRRSDGDGGS